MLYRDALAVPIVCVMTSAASSALETVGDGTFHLYRGAVLVCAVLLVVLAAWGLGATVLARVFSGVAGVLFLAYGAYLTFFLRDGQLYELYTFLFILPVLLVGYQFYSRVLNREIEAQAQAAFEAERAQRRAGREAGNAGTGPEGAAPTSAGETDGTTPR
jgi:hypothetical protein